LIEGGIWVCVDVPFSLADFLSEAEPETVFPAPCVGVVFEWGDGAVAGREEAVVAADGGALVDDALPLGATGWRGHVDLVIVFAPWDMNAQAFFRAVQCEGMDTARHGIELGMIEHWLAFEGVFRFAYIFPLANVVGGKLGACQCMDPEADAVGLE
jgi:hypothetical protein